MSLPFADKPEASSIYQDLKSLVLSDLTAVQFDELRDRIFSEGVNGTEDEYRRLLLLGLASSKVSTSGPVCESVTVYVDNDTSGVKTAIFGGGSLDSKYSKDDTDVIFPANSAWVCSGISMYGTGISGSVNHDVWYYPAGETPVESKATLIVDFSSTGGNQPLFSSETGGLNDVLIDGDSTLWVEFTGTATNIRYSATFFRVR